MRTFFRVASALALALAVANCGFLKKKTDDAADAEAEAAATDTTADAAPVDAAPAPLASNEGDIPRFPDETKLDNVIAVVKRVATAREIPQTGKAVATLAATTTVTQIAQREKYFLITFDKPGDASTKLMGWVSQDAFSAISLDGGLKAITCTAPEVPLYSDSAFCGRTCTKDADCTSGQACKGTAQTFTAGKIGTSTAVCTVYKPTDAGAPVAVVDAGPAKPQGDQFPPTSGTTCPIGYSFLSKDKQCHRFCITPGMCPSSHNCIKCENKQVCSTNAALCK